MSDKLTFQVPGISCDHCRAAITAEVSPVPGVREVDVDLDGKRVTVAGTGLDTSAVRAAIEEAGYEVAS